MMPAAAEYADTLPAGAACEAGAPGRCIYCDARCNAGSFYHDYCHQAEAIEEQQRAQRQKLVRSRADGKD